MYVQIWGGLYEGSMNVGCRPAGAVKGYVTGASLAFAWHTWPRKWLHTCPVKRKHVGTPGMPCREHAWQTVA